ncbi:MAG TPA: N-methyl-L-tryptophan oxidase [Usitatibacter sp.]|nr:N-methyl-L-tryptophan oxidase [Usitatibacter sp.]
MTRASFDAIVVGLGAAGSATAWQLTRRGARVLGIDRFHPPHAFGSSHGDSRITRKAIGEGAAYVPLVLRSYELWREIESLTGANLLTVTGGLWISSSGRRAEIHVKDFFQNTLAAARTFGIPHEVLDAGQLRKDFPQFRISGDEHGYYEPDAGFLRPEACIRAQLDLARAGGAELHSGERVLSFEERGEGVVVKTDRGEYRAAQLVLCAGAWIMQLLAESLSQLFTITRQVLYWYDVDAAYAQFAPPRFPVWIWELADRDQAIYGFPAIDGPTAGAKIATEQYRAAIRPEALDDVDRHVSEAEAREMHGKLVAPYVPELGPRLVKAAACLYTGTPDFHFVIDRHPQMPRVVVASPCSGHGFKHSAAVGEALAAMATGEAPSFDLSPFSLSRFARAARW